MMGYVKGLLLSNGRQSKVPFANRFQTYFFLYSCWKIWDKIFFLMFGRFHLMLYDEVIFMLNSKFKLYI